MRLEDQVNPLMLKLLQLHQVFTLCNGNFVCYIKDEKCSLMCLPSLVSSGVPRIDKLEIEGRGFHTNLYAVRGNYSGGKEGKSRIQWLRSMVGSPDLISIPGMLYLGCFFHHKKVSKNLAR